MKKSLLLFAVLFSFLMAGCYMAGTTDRLVYLPQPPDELFKAAKQMLIDMGFVIETEDIAPLKVIAKGPMIIAKRGDFSIMLVFVRKASETEITVHVSYIGKKPVKNEPEQLRDEIAEKLKQLK